MRCGVGFLLARCGAAGWHVSTVRSFLHGGMHAHSGSLFVKELHSGGTSGLVKDRSMDRWTGDDQASTSCERSFTVATLAGTPSISGFKNGAGDQAKFDYPYGVAFDPSSNIV